MIDPDNERLFSLARATRFPCFNRNGKGPNASTVWRWATRGCRGHKLETITVGGTTCTSREAARRFLAALSAPPAAEHQAGGATDRRRQIGRAELILETARI